MKVTQIITALALCLIVAQGAAAADFESPPSFKASGIPGINAQGPGYTIISPVPSDGYLRDYSLKTPWGLVRVSGDQMLQMRIKEIAAVDAMSRTTDSKEFADAAVKAGLSPVQFAGSLVTNPVGTVKNTVTGVGQLFGGIAAGIGNAGKTQDDPLASITGAAKQKRLIAYQYGVDPYTDFKPLADKLNTLSGAAAVGGLAVTAAFIAVPGAAGTIVSNVSTANTLSNMASDNSAAQLLDINRKKLRQLGFHDDLIEEFLSNRNYTPVDATSIVDSLSRMGKLQRVDVMLARAVSAQDRDVAYFIRRRIEMTAEYQERTHALTGFSQFGNSPFPMSTTADNGVLGMFPIDILSWTESTGKAITALTAAARANGMTGPLVLHISGKVTKLARNNLTKLGWAIEENAAN